MQKLAERYRADPKIRRKQKADTFRYWVSIGVFNLFLGPVGLLFVFWFQSAADNSFLNFLALPIARALWVALAAGGVVLSMMFISKKDKLWWRMAMQEIDSIDLPMNHRQF